MGAQNNMYDGNNQPAASPQMSAEDVMKMFPNMSVDQAVEALRGQVENTLQDILGGLRSICTYVGAPRLKELTKRTTFIRVAEQENRVYTE